MPAMSTNVQWSKAGSRETKSDPPLPRLRRTGGRGGRGKRMSNSAAREQASNAQGPKSNGEVVSGARGSCVRFQEPSTKKSGMDLINPKQVQQVTQLRLFAPNRTLNFGEAGICRTRKLRNEPNLSHRWAQMNTDADGKTFTGGNRGNGGRKRSGSIRPNPTESE
jgi:hypothetical protein